MAGFHAALRGDVTARMPTLVARGRAHQPTTASQSGLGCEVRNLLPWGELLDAAAEVPLRHVDVAVGVNR